MKKVFLGGTCNNSTWREELISLLKINYFNPVVEHWTPECMEEEIKQRGQCDFVLYVITFEMTGTYSIAEATDDSNKRPEKTVFCVLPEGFEKSPLKSLTAVSKLIQTNGGTCFSNLEHVANYLNSF